jgi:hypothetical protein
MGLHSESALNMKMVDLAKQLNLYLNHFPKHEKYGICQQIRSCLYDVYGLIVEAQKRYHKKTTLTNLDIEHEKLRWFCFLSNELGYFEFSNGQRDQEGYKRYLVISAMVDEVGRMIGGWIQHQREQEGS